MAIGKKSGGRDFQEGQSGNPAGRPPTSPEYKRLKRMNQERFARLCNRYFAMPTKDLLQLMKLQSTPGFDRMIIKEVLRGGTANLKFFAERLIGRVKTQVELSTAPGRPLEARIGELSDEDLKARVLELLTQAGVKVD